MCVEFGRLSGDAKVCHLRHQVIIEQNIAGLHIPVYHRWVLQHWSQHNYIKNCYEYVSSNLSSWNVAGGIHEVQKGSNGNNKIQEVQLG